MRVFMWHKDQKAVSHCLTAIYSANGPDMNTDPSEILSLSLSLREREIEISLRPFSQPGL